MKRFLIGYCLLTTCLLFMQRSIINEQQVDELKNKKPVIIYQVDNAGGELIGTVTDKAIVDGHYTVTIGAYGKFLVTKEQYESINIGDDAPGYLKK